MANQENRGRDDSGNQGGSSGPNRRDAPGRDSGIERREQSQNPNQRTDRSRDNQRGSKRDNPLESDRRPGESQPEEEEEM